jgi:small subunit ribosomal protein S7
MSDQILLFNRWSVADVKVEDPGLKKYINLKSVIIPKSGGRFATKPFHKNDMSIVERLINKMAIPGHKGKKHEIASGHMPGRYQTLCSAVIEAFEIIERKTKMNPVQVLVRAIENSALYEEVAGYRMGGMIARKAVITSPQRRLDLALRYITQGIFRSSFKKKTDLPNAIANELMAIYNNDNKSLAIRERNRLEKEAEGAR